MHKIENKRLWKEELSYGGGSCTWYMGSKSSKKWWIQRTVKQNTSRIKKLIQEDNQSIKNVKIRTEYTNLMWGRTNVSTHFGLLLHASTPKKFSCYFNIHFPTGLCLIS